MKKKKVMFISCFHWYSDRMKHLEKLFLNNKYEICVYESNFNHLKKEVYESDNDSKNIHYIPTLPYKKNLSFNRIISHYKFSQDIKKNINKEKPDIIYVVLPPNSLAPVCIRYKKKNNIKVIIDIIDLWPESLIGEKLVLQKLLFWWSNMRNKCLKKADLVITECDLYQRVLKNNINLENTDTIYLKKKATSDVKIPISFSDEIIELGYVGSINNIIADDLIVKVVAAISKYKKVNIQIIGKGENTEYFLEKLEKVSSNVSIKFWGAIFDEVKKKEILSNCHLGINLMKDTVKVGLTIKSIDYFEMGLPILNNIVCDTSKLVDKYSAGFNVNSN